MQHHLILVGLPGAGKSAVGRLLADLLNVDAIDIDYLVESTGQCRIAKLIENLGEPEFRRLEKIATEQVLQGVPSVVVPGGGWAAHGDNLSAVHDRAFSVYLETSPQTAVKRLTGYSDRPLLNVPDPLNRMQDLYDVRRPFYERCDATVSTEGKSVRDVALDVFELARGAIGG